MTRRHRSNLVPGSYRNQRIVTPMNPPGVMGLWRGPNLLVDGDMEAVGVGAWAAANAVLTKQIADPYQGLQYMRSVNTGAGSGRFGQTVMTIGLDYRITGVARNFFGNDTPRIFDGGGWVWIGTVGMAWQDIDVVFTAPSATLDMYTWGGGLGDGSEWDNLYLSLE